jgi:hypothetical protein
LAAYHSLTSSTEAAQASQDYPRQLGLSGLFSGIFPTFRFGNYLGLGPRNNSVFRESSYSYNPSLSVSLNRKAHTLRLTSSLRHNFDNVSSPFAPAGYFTFGSAITGLPGVRNTGNWFASFLLGLVYSGSVACDAAIGREPAARIPAIAFARNQLCGWRSRNLFVDSLVRLNAVPIENLKYRDQLYDQRFRDALRPFPQYRNLELGGVYPAGKAHSHALGVTLDKRLSAGLSGRVSYRFAKQLDNVSSGSPQDPNNLDVEMSLSVNDITHSLSASYTYELPFGKGKAWSSNGEWISTVIGGWSVSGLTSWRGGNPLVIRPLFNRSGNIVNNLHVNAVPGVNPKVENRTPNRWFNSAAFAQPDDFTIGNAACAHPTLREPSAQFHHLSMTKWFELGGDKTLEWVAEAFNFPNHANLNDPDTRIGPPASPYLNAGRIIGSRGGRVMQLGLRILF